MDVFAVHARHKNRCLCKGVTKYVKLSLEGAPHMGSKNIDF